MSAAGGGDSKKRPARQQLTKPVGPSLGVAPKADYNIWYHKNPGARPPTKVKAVTRCHPNLDSGETRAKPDAYLCVHFARGQCTQGAACTYFHRVPTQADDSKLSVTKDVFGRDRYATDRDDAGGVGSFSRENTTLYVGGLRATANSGGGGGGGGWDKTESLIRSEFGVWGSISKIHLVREKGIAFVTYAMRAASEFAKEAMHGQAIGPNGIGADQLNVRWANDDPNPKVRADRDSDNRSRLASAIRKRDGITDDADASGGGGGFGQKRMRIAGTTGKSGYATEADFAASANASAAAAAAAAPVGPDPMAYPDTSHQFPVDVILSDPELGAAAAARRNAPPRLAAIVSEQRAFGRGQIIKHVYAPHPPPAATASVTDSTATAPPPPPAATETAAPPPPAPNRFLQFMASINGGAATPQATNDSVPLPLPLPTDPDAVIRAEHEAVSRARSDEQARADANDAAAAAAAEQAVAKAEAAFTALQKAKPARVQASTEFVRSLTHPELLADPISVAAEATEDEQNNTAEALDAAIASKSTQQTAASVNPLSLIAGYGSD